MGSDSLNYDASYFNNDSLRTAAAPSSPYYQREAVNVLNANLDDAVNIGTLTYEKTQLGVASQISKANPVNYYNFTLDGDTLKLDVQNFIGTATIRIQLMDSDGDVIADSSTFADADLQTAYASLNSSNGLDAEAGEYYTKITFDATEYRSVPQTYQMSLYSGVRFSRSYETIASSQVKSSQHVTIDNTMTFSTLNAEEYSNQDVHRANATAESAINIGWLYENKTALGTQSTLTDICDEQYYSFTLQKGETIKTSLDNKADESDRADIRVQVLEPSGTYVYADSHGTDEQKAAYAELISSTGLEVDQGTYVIKISFAQGEDKSKDQSYGLKIYSGNTYEDYYETLVATENAATAVLSGTYTDIYNPKTSLASYLLAKSNEEQSDIMAALADFYS